MTRKYEISNTVSGHVFGVYEGDTEQQALDAFAQDAGYADYASAQKTAPAQDGEISCVEVE